MECLSASYLFDTGLSYNINIYEFFIAWGFILARCKVSGGFHVCSIQDPCKKSNSLLNEGAVQVIKTCAVRAHNRLRIQIVEPID